MKKLVLFVMAVMAFAGMSVAQDVYSGGHFKDDDYVQQAAVYRNETRLYYSTIGNGTGDHYGECTGVDVYQGDVYWVRNCLTSGGGFYFADVMKNNDIYLDSPVNQGRHINDLYRWPENPSLGLFSVGCMDINAVRTAVIWKDDNPDVFRQLGDGTWPSVAYAATANDDGLYVCGYQYGYEETTYHGVIWMGGSEFDFPDGTKIYDIAYSKERNSIYSVGVAYEDGQYKLKVWENDEELYTLVNNTGGGTQRMSICVDDAGDVYVSAYGGSDPDVLWKNGQEIFNTPGYITSVVANSNGVYCAGSESSVGYIWKDGELLYHPTNSERITCLYIAEPECTNSEARTLPYFEGFETGATDWACWTVEDNDNYNGGYRSYWHRGGENTGNNVDIPTGYNYAWHSYGPEDEPQEGWLTSPRIAIPEGGAVTLTFMTYEGDPSYYQYEGVLVVCNGTTEVWSQPYEMASDEWKTVEIDLSSYRGQEIQLAFIYRGTYAHDWYIDDVRIEQEAAPASYTITTDVNPAGAGTVTGGGTYPEGTEVTLAATANTGYIFSHWSDGLTTNPRTITVNANANYTAYFITGGGGTMYTVNVVSENPLLGSVSGGGTYPAGAVIQISATPSPGARFVSWDDGNTDNPRTVTVTGDITYTAKFEALQNYTITVVSGNPAMGTVEGGGTFLEGTVINISATPLTGYYFIGWSDGNADNPRSITVTANETYVAQFGTNPVQTFSLTVMCNSSEGTTIGSGTYTAGSTVTIAAFPNSGYLFDKWQDNVTDNPRQVTVTGDMTFVAFFKSTGVGENEGRLLVLYPNPANDYIRIEGLEANSEVKIYNTMGALVKVVNVNANEEIGISELSDGLYVLRCGNATLRFVKK